jgi:hypothetical protein
LPAAKEYHVLNLGAGVQSTTLYLMAMEPEYGLRFDAAIFADTKGEPRKVYRHLKWLKSLGGPRIIVTSKGSLHANLLTGQNATGQKFVSIPAFTKGPLDEKEGLIRRQCTKEYKNEPVERAIRRVLLGLKPKQRTPRNVTVHQYFGISVDEARRRSKILARLAKNRWAVGHFPLIDMGWGRRGCQEFLRTRVPHKVARSACKFCPLRDDHEWAEMAREEPKEFAEACKVDEQLRLPGTVANRGTDKPMYLHRSCIPLKMVDFDSLPPQQLDGFTLYDCSGACGN